MLVDAIDSHLTLWLSLAGKITRHWQNIFILLNLGFRFVYHIFQPAPILVRVTIVHQKSIHRMTRLQATILWKVAYTQHPFKGKVFNATVSQGCSTLCSDLAFRFFRSTIARKDPMPYKFYRLTGGRRGRYHVGNCPVGSNWRRRPPPTSDLFSSFTNPKLPPCMYCMLIDDGDKNRAWNYAPQPL